MSWFYIHMRYNGYMDDVTLWDLLNPNAPRSAAELKESRLAICRKCEFFKPRTERCSKCGCFMKLKTELEYARCPIGKW
jgi:uncharacterized paraquat-inducible protein A